MCGVARINLLCLLWIQADPPQTLGFIGLTHRIGTFDDLWSVARYSFS